MTRHTFALIAAVWAAGAAAAPLQVTVRYTDDATITDEELVVACYEGDTFLGADGLDYAGDGLVDERIPEDSQVVGGSNEVSRVLDLEPGTSITCAARTEWPTRIAEGLLCFDPALTEDPYVPCISVWTDPVSATVQDEAPGKPAVPQQLIISQNGQQIAARISVDSDSEVVVLQSGQRPQRGQVVDLDLDPAGESVRVFARRLPPKR